jgi:hypothetical protein
VEGETATSDMLLRAVSHSPVPGGGGQRSGLLPAAPRGSRTGTPCSVGSFDLATEQWRPTAIEGPPGDGSETGSYLGLRELNGCLVGACRTYKTRATELWFLEDEATGLWTKRYSLPWFGLFHLVAVSYDKRIVVWAKTGRSSQSI